MTLSGTDFSGTWDITLNGQLFNQTGASVTAIAAGLASQVNTSQTTNADKFTASSEGGVIVIVHLVAVDGTNPFTLTATDGGGGAARTSAVDRPQQQPHQPAHAHRHAAGRADLGSARRHHADRQPHGGVDHRHRGDGPRRRRRGVWRPARTGINAQTNFAAGAEGATIAITDLNSALGAVTLTVRAAGSIGAPVAATVLTFAGTPNAGDKWRVKLTGVTAFEVDVVAQALGAIVTSLDGSLEAQTDYMTQIVGDSIVVARIGAAVALDPASPPTVIPNGTITASATTPSTKTYTLARPAQSQRQVDDPARQRAPVHDRQRQ